MTESRKSQRWLLGFFLLLACFFGHGLNRCLAGEAPVYIQFNGYGFACIEYEDLIAVVESGKWDPGKMALKLRGKPVPMLVLGGEDHSFDPGDAILFFSEESAWRYTNTYVYSLHFDSADGAFLEIPEPWSPDIKHVVVSDEHAEKMFTYKYSHAFARSKLAELKLPFDYTPFQELTIEIVPDPPCDPSDTYLVRTPNRERTVKALPDGTIRFEYSLAEDGRIGKLIWFSSKLKENTESYRIFLWEPRKRDNHFALYLNMQQDLGLLLMPGFKEADYFVWHVEEKKLLLSGMLDHDAKRMLGFPLKKGKSQVWIATKDGALRPTRVFCEEKASADTIDAKYLAIAPRKFMQALEDHLEYRREELGSAACVSLERIYNLYSHNDPDPIGIKAFIEEKAPNVEYVLLAGAAKERVNAGYGRPYSLPCEHYDTFDLLPPLPYMFKNVFVPCDMPFGDKNLDGRPEIAVGRIPCATAKELEVVLKKIRDYERAHVESDWGRRLFVQAGMGRYDAYGGDPEAQKLLTQALETLAGDLAYTWIPPGYSMEVLYGNPDSPYLFPPTRMREQAIEELNKGYAAAFYVGPGLVRRYGNFSWRKTLYETFFAEDAARVAIETGRGPYFALTGSAGTFTQRKGTRCVAEELIMNPKGPCAVIAASRDVDNVANTLFSSALLKHMFHDRVPRIGDLLNEAKKTMPELLENSELSGPLNAFREKSIINIPENERILLGQYQFNLFGDPAMKIRHPAGKIELTAPATTQPGGKVIVEGRVTGIADGNIRIELEWARSRIHKACKPPSEEHSLQEAEALIEKNYFIANGRTFLSTDCLSNQGAFRTELTIPEDIETGPIWIKAHTNDDLTHAMGALKIEVR